MNRPILLLGQTGQVGFELARVLPTVAEVVCLPRTDLAPSQAAMLDAKIDAMRPAVIVNAAAYTAVDMAESDVDTAFAVNADLPERLARACARSDASLVHYSTDYVFDGSKEAPYAESDPTSPLSVYGRSKLAGEERIRAANARHLILRTSWVFGVHGKNFIKTVVRLAREKDVLTIVADQFGAPTGARLLADATTQALRCLQSSQPAYGTFHLTASGSTNWHQLASLVVDRMRSAGLPVKAREVKAIRASDYPVAAMRPLNSRLNCARFAEAFAVRLPEWELGVQQALELILQ